MPLMSNLEHDEIYRAMGRGIVSCARNLEAANQIAILKELYELEELPKNEYVKLLQELAGRQGLVIK